MAKFYTVPTAVGEAKIANAIALGRTLTIAELAIGDGNGELPDPDSDRTSLVNQVRRAPINTSVVDDDNPNWIVVEQVIPPDEGGWTIREIGLFDSDGDMIAYGNYPETYKPVLSEGSGRTQTIRFVMQVSDTAAVTLKVDPSVVLATREYVDDEIDQHAQSRNHPDATTSAKGMMQFGTSEQTRAGTRTDRAAHLAGVKAAIDQHKEEAQAHNASKIALDTPLNAFGDADTVQAVLALLGAAAKAETHNGIAGRSNADAHPMSAISGLDAAITSINEVLNGLGAAAQAENHNDIAGRDASGAHPMSAITGLNAAIEAINDVLDGLGSAATRTVGTNSGNVMEVGAFGLGSQDPPELSDFNIALDTGAYTARETALNSPPGWSGGVATVITRSGGDYSVQMAFDVNTRNVYVRVLSQGVWRSWDSILTSADFNPDDYYTKDQLFAAVHDETNNRSEGATYTNTTGKPMLVAVTKNNQNPAVFHVDGIEVGLMQDASGDARSNLTFIVPNGSTYGCDTNLGTINDIIWVETY
ncbi:phage tail protein [Chromohalobacter nigrandesensis]|uniref:phage tail-collar fiber domain-containing protein n=1 Tax=Chromohalobacter nigrandesensis TaxID=119863 RepID=UPI001FF61CC4|nr:phage tail protein [Chromohalobacter nigrandesensis]MCK0743562.1 phage tail protein [Chromohalobacter nigrandesensis]